MAEFTKRAVTTILALIASLTFLFCFGNVWSLGHRLGVPPWVAPLVGPAVDLSVVGLLIAVRYLTACGCSRRDLRPARLLLVLCGTATLALNIAEPVVEGDYGRAAFDAVGPLLLLGWSEVGPGLLRLINQARTLDQASTTSPADAPAVAVLPDDATLRAHQVTGQPITQHRPPRSATQEGGSSDADLWARASDIDLAHRSRHGRPVSADTLRVELHVGTARARALIRALRAPTSTAADNKTIHVPHAESTALPGESGRGEPLSIDTDE